MIYKIFTILCLLLLTTSAFAAPTHEDSNTAAADTTSSFAIQEVGSDFKNTDKTKLVFKINDAKKTRFLVDRTLIDKYSDIIRKITASSSDPNESIPLQNETNPDNFETLIKLLKHYDDNKAHVDNGTMNFQLDLNDVPALVNLADFLFSNNTIEKFPENEELHTIDRLLKKIPITSNDLGFFLAIQKAAASILFDPAILKNFIRRSDGSSTTVPPYLLYVKCMPFATPWMIYRFRKALRGIEHSKLSNDAAYLKTDFQSLFMDFSALQGTTLSFLPFQGSGTITQPYIVITEGENKKNSKLVDTLFKKNPHATLIIDFGTKESIDFFNNVNDGKMILLPSSVKKLSIGGDKITQIGGDFLAGYSSNNLTQLDLSGLSGVTQIGHSFFYKSNFTQLDLSPFSNVTEIRGNFLAECSSLATLDLRPFSNVTEIGEGFLAVCSSLATLDLRPLSKLTKIGENFLAGCSRLTKLDLSPFSNVTEIGRGFLSWCSDLAKLDLRPLSKLTKIRGSFLQECTALTLVDLPDFIQFIDNEFLAGTTSLQSIYVTEGSKTEQTIREQHPAFAPLIKYRHGSKGSMAQNE